MKQTYSYTKNILLAMVLACSGLAGTACNVQSTRQNMRRAQAFYTIGVKQSNQGQFRQALASLKRAEELNPDNYWIQEALGGTFHRMGRLDMAVHHYKKALEIEPKSPRGYNNLGAAYMGLGKWSKAIKLFKTALDNMLYQTPCFARINIAWSYHQIKDYKNSDQFFDMVVQGCPRVCQGHRLRGLAAHERKKYQEAKQSFIELRRRCKKFLPGYYYLARAHMRLKDFDNARPLLRQCVDKSDNFPKLQTKCRTLLLRLPQQRTAQPNPIAAPQEPKEKPFIYIKPHPASNQH